ncbi:unnamed protein product [Echinostoma caproni]|uniref:EAL domain-containing protein n=1 Tax=Echinostoma caproni TaxID=27848 RepID=A0A183AAZ6_9TREM|nr:unnamed protein product [Echinostoma caproni]
MAFSVNLRAEGVSVMGRKRLERIEELDALGIGMIVTDLQQSWLVEVLRNSFTMEAITPAREAAPNLKRASSLVVFPACHRGRYPDI